MATRTVPNRSTRGNRTNGANVPEIGAQAEAEQALPNSVTEAPHLEVGRKRSARKAQNAVAPESNLAHQASAGTHPSSPATRLELLDRVMPERIWQRYSNIGDDFHFPDGNLAFRDEGNRLSTKLENRELVRDLVAIARERGWAIEISGTQEFKRRAWQEAQLAGLTVRNYEPTELERQQLAQRLSRERSTTSQASPTGASAVGSPGTTGSLAEPPVAARDPAPPPTAADRIYRGRLVDHGIDRYQFDPRNEESYFVILDTPDRGEQLIWGKDLQRALEQSLSKPQAGQEIVVRQLGAKPVTVSRPVRDPEGQVITQTQVKTHLNRWLVETEEFLREREKLADVVRDVGIDPQRAVAQHPELAGTYSELHAARLVALHQNYRHPADLERFVNRTREAIAQEIERGEPLSAPLVKARYQGDPAQRMREPIQQRTL
jgi:hypothetical protein